MLSRKIQLGKGTESDQVEHIICLYKVVRKYLYEESNLRRQVTKVRECITLRTTRRIVQVQITMNLKVLRPH